MNALRRWWYRVRYGIDGSLLPSFGLGRFVSVLRRGAYVDVVSHQNNMQSLAGTIRVIPASYNHGFMLEYRYPNGVLSWRTHLDYDAMYLHGAGCSENYLPPSPPPSIPVRQRSQPPLRGRRHTHGPACSGCAE